jgi:hypothetical protein
MTLWLLPVILNISTLRFIFVRNSIVIELYFVPTKISRKRFTGFTRLVTWLPFSDYLWTMSENEVGRITSVLRVAGSEYFCHEKIPVSQGLSNMSPGMSVNQFSHVPRDTEIASSAETTTIWQGWLVFISRPCARHRTLGIGNLASGIEITSFGSPICSSR